MKYRYYFNVVNWAGKVVHANLLNIDDAIADKIERGKSYGITVVVDEYTAPKNIFDTEVNNGGEINLASSVESVIIGNPLDIKSASDDAISSDDLSYNYNGLKYVVNGDILVIVELPDFKPFTLNCDGRIIQVDTEKVHACTRFDNNKLTLCTSKFDFKYSGKNIRDIILKALRILPIHIL